MKLQTSTCFSTIRNRWLLAATLSLGSPLFAQQQAYLGDLFVDVEFGSDTTGTGTPANPFHSITKALTMTNVNQSGPIAIVINPGFYDSSVETFPLVMKKDVSLQGTSALNTYIRGDEAATDPVILFNAGTAGKFDHNCIDGLTVARGEVGIRITGTFAANPTISNCFIVDFSATGIDVLSDGPVHRPKIIHTTFALSNSAITNRTSATPAGQPPTVPPISKPGLLNILAGKFVTPTVDLLGIDDSDMRGVDSLGSPFGPNNSAFDAASPVGVALAPTPLFMPGTVANLFIEQFIHGGFVGVLPDLRINPGLTGSPTPIDNGFGPVPGPITWNNGTVGNYVYEPSRGATLGDYDCEGYGNPRTVNTPDIGADEVGDFVLANYIPGTTQFSGGQFAGFWIGPNVATSGDKRKVWRGVPLPSQRYVSNCPGVLGCAPQNRARGTTLPGTDPVLAGATYLDPSDPNFTSAGYSITTSQPKVFVVQTVTQRTLFNEQRTLLGTTVSNLQTYIIN